VRRTVYVQQKPRCSGRELARQLGVSHTHIQKLVRNFAALIPYLDGVFVEGQMLVPDENGQLQVPGEDCPATLEQLTAAREITRGIMKRGELRFRFAGCGMFGRRLLSGCTQAQVSALLRDL
jgi:hypothetical protein